MSRDQQPEVSTQPKQEWVMPRMRRIAAGSAEDDSGPNTDAITNPS